MIELQAPASDWIRRLRETAPMRVAVVGAAGRLGGWITRVLTDNGHDVLAVDSRPPTPLVRQQFVRCDIGRAATVPANLLRGCDAVLHLAALHGAHLVAGTPRRDFWVVNVKGTQAIMDAALEAGVRRFVFASSTSVHGSGSAEGQPAKVIDEETPLAPEDVYDLTKIAGERLMGFGRANGLEVVVLRFGRFHSPGHVDYQLRKLSTGLDVRDACQALARAMTAADLPHDLYCVASDLPLDIQRRRRLGVNAPEVLGEVLPSLVDIAHRKGVHIPGRIGKSVCTARIRRDLGFVPERALDWVVGVWSAPGEG